MGLEMLKTKYPIEGHRPTEVYTNEEGTINTVLTILKTNAALMNLPITNRFLKDSLTSLT